MKRKSGWVWLGSAVLLFAALASGQQLTFTPFSINGSLATTVYAINNAGVMVGAYETAGVFSGVFNGFMALGKTVTTINYPNATNTFCLGVNDGGQIVGEYLDAQANIHGFLYETGVFTEILPPGAIQAWAAGINDAGEIVGTYTDESHNEHGFLFDGASYQTIDVPGSIVTSAWGLNDVGEVTLQYGVSSGTGGSALYDGSTFTILEGVSGAQYTFAYGINDAGTVVLIWTDFFGFDHCDLRRSNGKYYPADDPATTRGTFCYGVNNRSVIVGSIIAEEGGNSGPTWGFRATGAPK